MSELETTHAVGIMRMPGEWLERALTEEEQQTITSFSDRLRKMSAEDLPSDEDFTSQIMPSINALMHLWFLLNWERQGLTAVMGGVLDKTGQNINVLAETLEFVKKSIVNSDTLAASMRSIKLPDKTATPMDRVTKLFFQNKFPLDKPMRVNTGTAMVKQANGKREKIDIAPIVTISLQQLPPGVVLSGSMEPFDTEVFRAVCALHEMGNKMFTGHDIYRVMTGNVKALATQDTLKLIEKSWIRLTCVSMRLDTGNVGDAYNFTSWTRYRRVIEGGFDTLVVKNQHGFFSTTVYTLFEEPILKTYASHLGQIARYPIKFLNTPVNKTPEVLVLQTALLDHIQAIPAISNHILYDTLFEKIDIQAPNDAAKRKKKAKLRKHLHKMLDFWMECGIITEWHEEKKDNALYCIVVSKPGMKKKELLSGER